jgi:hypothetical protein
MKMTSVMLSPADHASLQVLMAAWGLNQSGCIRRAIREAAQIEGRPMPSLDEMRRQARETLKRSKEAVEGLDGMMEAAERPRRRRRT